MGLLDGRATGGRGQTSSVLDRIRQQAAARNAQRGTAVGGAPAPRPQVQPQAASSSFGSHPPISQQFQADLDARRSGQPLQPQASNMNSGISGDLNQFAQPQQREAFMAAEQARDQARQASWRGANPQQAAQMDQASAAEAAYRSQRQQVVRDAEQSGVSPDVLQSQVRRMDADFESQRRAAVPQQRTFEQDFNSFAGQTRDQAMRAQEMAARGGADPRQAAAMADEARMRAMQQQAAQAQQGQPNAAQDMAAGGVDAQRAARLAEVARMDQMAATRGRTLEQDFNSFAQPTPQPAVMPTADRSLQRDQIPPQQGRQAATPNAMTRMRQQIAQQGQARAAAPQQRAAAQQAGAQQQGAGPQAQTSPPPGAFGAWTGGALGRDPALERYQQQQAQEAARLKADKDRAIAAGLDADRREAESMARLPALAETYRRSGRNDLADAIMWRLQNPYA